MRKRLGIIYYSGIVLFLLSFNSLAYGTDDTVETEPTDVNIAKNDGRIYDEYETVAGDIIGIGGTGASVSSQVSSIRINPAGINAKKVYSIEGSYNRPSFGGNFYQLGVVDTKTSVVGAGFLYSDFKDSVYSRREDNKDDSSVKRRFYLGFAAGNETISFGIMSNYTEAIDDTKYNESGDKIIERKKGFTFFSPGILVNIGSQFKLGLSLENLFNSKLKEYNPRFYRFGSSYHYSSSFFKLNINLDYRGRERISKEKNSDPTINSLEHMVFIGTSVIFSDIVKLMTGYGFEISGNSRQSLSYGVSLMKNNSSISFGCLYPYFNEFKDTHLGFNLSYDVVI